MTTRWLPRTETELADAVLDGRLAEDHTTDFKESLKPGNASNKELARDLASFANDGGLMIFGVADTGDTPEERLWPMELEGVPERIDQVARSRLEPPLSVQVRSVVSESDPQYGYLLVEIPASPGAPHQCDERYWGRSDETKHALANAEVRAILAARERDQESIAWLLEKEVQRDPIPHDQRRLGHLHILAMPRYARDGALYRALSQADKPPERALRDVILQGEASTRLQPGWFPDFGQDAGKMRRRARGWAVHSHEITTAREWNPEGVGEEALLDLEIDETGAIHLLCGRATHNGPDGSPLIMLSVIAGLLSRAVLVAGSLSRLMGYSGAWDFGIAADGLRGGIDGDAAHDTVARLRAIRYSEPQYRQILTALAGELESDCHGLVDRLLGQLARGLGKRDSSWIPSGAF